MAAVVLKKLGQRETAASQRSATETVRPQEWVLREGERIFFKFSVCDNFPLKGIPSLILVVPVLGLRDVSITL